MMYLHFWFKEWTNKHKKPNKIMILLGTILSYKETRVPARSDATYSKYDLSPSTTPTTSIYIIRK